MSRPTVLFSRRVLLPSGFDSATVVIEGERVTDVRHGRSDGAEDLGDHVLMPGLVDSHVHINEPGRTEWEGFETATRAAAVGGVTTVVDMPLNSDPVTTSADALDRKLSASAGKLHVDCGFWGGVVPGNDGELDPMARMGAMGFKAFLCHSGIDDFPASDAEVLRRAMPRLRAAGVPLLVHAELESELAEVATSSEPTAYASWLHSRPRAWEDAAIAMMIGLVEETGCRVHIVHLSSGSALPMLRKARAKGLPITVETCPHYLCLVAEQVPPGATSFKCAPPIREQANCELLWQGLADSTIDFVISDHSPCIPGLKKLEEGDFLEAWGGIASLQLGLSTVWTEARRRGFGPADLARWMSAGPARFLGLPDRSSIRAGGEANLVAWDPDASWTIAAEALHHRHPITPYLGRTVEGVVSDTWVRGHRVVSGGVLAPGAAVGRPVFRS